MYCPHCGTESTQGLNYCNRCGGSLTVPTHTEAQEARPALSTGTAWAAGVTMLLVVCVGLAAVFGTISDLAHFIKPDAIVALAICGSATILGSVFLLTRFWMRLLAGAKQGGPASHNAPRRAATGELNPARMSALPDTAPPPPISSVTEQTTRTLRK